MNSKTVGERSEAMVLAAFLKVGKVVLQPFGDNQRYDLVLDEGGKFVRVQVKTGRLKDGAIVTPTSSTYAHRGGKRRNYRGQADFFAIYCPEMDRVYMVPVADAGDATVTLRVTVRMKNSARSVKMACDYELSAG